MSDFLHPKPLFGTTATSSEALHEGKGAILPPSSSVAKSFVDKLGVSFPTKTGIALLTGEAAREIALSAVKSINTLLDAKIKQAEEKLATTGYIATSAQNFEKLTEAAKTDTGLWIAKVAVLEAAKSGATIGEKIFELAGTIGKYIKPASGGVLAEINLAIGNFTDEQSINNIVSKTKLIIPKDYIPADYMKVLSDLKNNPLDAKAPDRVAGPLETTRQAYFSLRIAESIDNELK